MDCVLNVDTKVEARLHIEFDFENETAEVRLNDARSVTCRARYMHHVAEAAHALWRELYR